MTSYVFLVGVVGKRIAGLALQSIRVRLHFEMRRHQWIQQKLGQLRNAGDGKRVHEFEGRDGVKTDHSFGFCEEPASSCDAHQRVLEIYKRPLQASHI